MGYLVFYSENASPKVKSFKNKKAAITWANCHEKLNVGEYPDEWVDCVVKGEIVKTYPNWYDKQVKEK